MSTFVYIFRTSNNWGYSRKWILNSDTLIIEKRSTENIDELFKKGIEINPRVREIFTDDTVMTVAVGKALSQTFDKPAEEIKLR